MIHASTNKSVSMRILKLCIMDSSSEIGIDEQDSHSWGSALSFGRISVQTQPVSLVSLDRIMTGHDHYSTARELVATDLEWLLLD
jgi:hypothetical protein